MKIFYWLHRRLYTNLEYCRVPHHNKGDVYIDDSCSADHGAMKVGTEKEALLLDPNVTSIQHVLNGILTIGTLGHLDGHFYEGSLGVAADVSQEFPFDTSAFKEEEEEEEGLASSAEHPNHRLAIESFRKEVEEDVKNIGKVERMADEEDLLKPLLGEIIEADKRERVTLADLLAAEQLHSEKADPTSQTAASAAAKTALEKVANGATKMTVVAASLSCSAKHSLARNKKLVPWKKEREYSPPANGKLHQRIRRMLKKKIHPEMARDVQARGGDQGSHDKTADKPVSLIWYNSRTSISLPNLPTLMLIVTSLLVG